MSRTIKWRATCALAVAGVVGLVFLSACNVTSSSAGGTARLNVLMTDAPSDDWSVVQVTITSVSLHNADTHSWANVWSGAQNVNLVDFSGVNGFLALNTTIDSGIYDGMKLTIDPTSFVLTDSNTPANTYSGTNVTVVDPSGKGEIKVTIYPPVTLSSSTTDVESLGLDFDLAHPLSIIVQNGKVIVNLQVRHKALPRNLKDIQFARSLGHVTAVDTANTPPKNFNMHTLEGVDLTFNVDDKTVLIEVADDGSGKAGTFDGLKSVIDTSTDYSSTKGALVASNMLSDGTLYARQVWYGTITALPQFTPEGIVRAVGDNWIKVLNKNAANTGGEHMSCHWDSDIIYVNSATVWTFHGDATVPLPQGTAMLKNIRRGFRVVVTLDSTAAPTRLASSIDIQSAHDEGAIRSVSATGFTFGGSGYHDGWNCRPGEWGYFSHEWPFSDVTDHLFSWWFYGMTPATTTDPTALTGVITNFTDTVAAAKSANLRVFAWAELYWKGDATTGQWAAENVVFAPEKLPDPTKITQNYAQADLADPTKGGSMVVSTFDWDDDALPTAMTVNLDASGDLQTIVESILWNSSTRILTSTVPVPPAQWKDLLTTSILGVRVWVRPEEISGTPITWNWHAYAVMAFQITN
jgi:hypothetical protein